MKSVVFTFFLLVSALLMSSYAHENEDVVSFEADQALQQELLSSLVASPQVKEFYVSQCSSEMAGIFGEKLDLQVCECTYGQILNNPALQYSIINDTEIPDVEFRKMVENCLPATFNMEMEKAFIATCVKAGSSEADCLCWFRGVKSLYNPRTLVLDIFGQSERFQSNMTRLMSECLAY